MDYDKRRRFNKKEKLAAWLSQDGKSAVSGKFLDPTNMHGDHRIPYSKGGPTSIENCDAITPQENLSKGNRMNKNRFAWQDEFIEKYQSHTSPNFFLCALPGGGKTYASIRVVRLWLEKGGIVVVVSPTRQIKRHWRSKMREAGINLDENFYGFLKEPYQGISTTYQALKSQSLIFRKFCSDHSVMLICDEIHHASEGKDSKFGFDLQEAFDLAKRRLLLSGTPLRSDGVLTKWLKVVNGSYVVDFPYDWPRALSDDVVRRIIFHREKMEFVDVQYEKEKKQFSNDDESYLSYALDDRSFLLSILRNANRKLDEIREIDPKAAAMVVAKDISHAKKIYELLEILGQKPTVVTSDPDQEEDSLYAIEEFTKNVSKKWLVSVQIVSEGVDIPRLKVLAYLTNKTTNLIFRQLIGRCVRREESESDEQAIANVFIPEVKKLTEFAETIEKLQELAWEEKEKREIGENGTKDFKRGYTIGGSEPEFVGYIIHGQHYIGDRVSVIKQLREKYKISEASAILMLNDPTFAQGLKTGEPLPDIELNKEPPWEKEDRLKKDANELVRQLTKIRQRRRGHGETYNRNVWESLTKEVNIEFMIDKVPQSQMSINQLQRKIDKLRDAILREQDWL